MDYFRPSRKIILQQREIAYALQLRKGGGISILICPEHGLLVRAAARTSMALVEAELCRRSAWVLKHLDKLAARGLPLPPRAYAEGERLPYQGECLALRFLPSLGGRAQIRRRGQDLVLHVPWELTEEERRACSRKLLKGWYTAEAKRYLPLRVGDFAGRLGLVPPPVKINQAKSQWGNCNQQGVIRLNWRLMLLPLELSDYVVAHEACHLRHLDHSARFWALLHSLLPAASRLRRKLKEQGPCYQLN